MQYKGRQSNVVTQEMLSKISFLADIRRSNGVEIAEVIFENNLNVTFIFYFDDDPYDAFYERIYFMSSSDFEKGLNRQIEPNFISKMKGQKQVIFKYGYEIDLLLFKKQKNFRKFTVNRCPKCIIQIKKNSNKLIWINTIKNSIL